MAPQVLASVGWNTTCVYEDTLFPHSQKENPINWNKIRNKEDETQQKEDEKTKTNRHWRLATPPTGNGLYDIPKQRTNGLSGESHNGANPWR